jgi:hypothetical protein
MFNINLVRLKPRNCISFALLRMTKQRNGIIGDKRIKDRAALSGLPYLLDLGDTYK